MKHTVFELDLKNGTKGLLIHIPQASVMTFEVSFRAGEYLVKTPKWETPHLMEHLLLGANQLIPKARAFQAEFEKNGAYSNASTGTYDITYEAECADFEWDRVLGLLLTAIAKPLFLEEEFDAEFGNVREELMARSNNHFRHLSLALRQAYGFKVMTDLHRFALMDNVSVDDVREHYARTHTTSNLRFVIAGNINAERRRIIKQLFASLELPLGNGRTALPIERPQRLEQPLHIQNETVDNLYFYLDTFLLRRLDDPETDALGLVNAILTETLYSRIWGTARERGLVYHMNSGYGLTEQTSNWWFGAQVLAKNVAPLFDIITKELEGVFAGKLSNEDIEAAKQYALGRYQRSGQTVGGISSGYAQRYFFDDHIDDYYKLPQRIKAITEEGIIAVSKALFEDKIWGFGTLGNAGETFSKKLHKQIRPLWK